MRNAFSGGAFADDLGEPLGGHRVRRAAVGTNRHNGADTVGDEPDTAPTPASTPIYDQLNPDQRNAVDRMIVAVRLSTMRGAT